MTNTLLRRLVLPSLLIGFAAANASAANVCVNETLAALISQTATTPCSFQDKLFSNFVFLFSGSTSNGAVPLPLVPSTSNVNVVFSNGAIDSNGIPASVSIQFQFTTNNTVAQSQSMDLQVQYKVAIAGSTNATITSIGGNGTGAFDSTNNSNPTPLDSYKDSCLGGVFNVTKATNRPQDLCASGTQTTVYNTTSFAGGTGLTNPNTQGGSINFSGQPSAGIFDEFLVDGGGGTSPTANAEVIQFTNTFFQTDTTPSGTPEPGTLALMGGALVGLSAFLRRKKA